MSALALVLGGGGAKGDFEVGALHFVYGALGRRPDVLSCTSVGAVNGLKLAEGEGGPTQGLAGLTRIWLSLDSTSDFFTVSPWLESPEPAIRYVRQFLFDTFFMNPAAVEEEMAVNPVLQDLRTRELAAIAARLEAIPVDEQLEALGALGILHLVSGLLPTPTGVMASAASATAIVAALAPTIGAASAGLSATSMFTLGPLVARTTDDLDRASIAGWARRGGRLRMATVGLHTGLLRYTTETGGLVEADGSPVLTGEPSAPACAGLAAAVDELTAEESAIQDAIGRRERTPISPPPSLAEVKLDLATAAESLAACLAANAPARQPVAVDLVQGMLASATMPAFFPAVQLDGEEYVDGGVRTVVPVEMALRLTEPDDQVIVIAASKAGLDPARGPMDMKAAALRSLMDVAINEIARRDTDPPTGFGDRDVTVVQPRVDIHTTISLYPAFVRQRMAYGFMCAADELAPAPDRPEEARAAADRIAVLRYGVARLERWLAGAPVPPAMVAMGRPDAGRRIECANTLAAMKNEIRTLVELRTSLGAGMPTGVGDWDDPVMWWSQPEAQPGVPGVFGRDDAAFVAQSMPLSVTSGSTQSVSITMRNTGGTRWAAAAGYRLSPVDGAWGVGPVPVPQDVGTQETVTFSFALTAPATTGAATFSWRMINGAGAVFGDSTEPVAITATPAGEPAGCAALRERVAAIGVEIEQIEALMTGDPQRDGPRQRRITALTLERENATRAAVTLGCTV